MLQKQALGRDRCHTGIGCGGIRQRGKIHMGGDIGLSRIGQHRPWRMGAKRLQCLAEPAIRRQLVRVVAIINEQRGAAIARDMGGYIAGGDQ